MLRTHPLSQVVLTVSSRVLTVEPRLCGRQRRLPTIVTLVTTVIIISSFVRLSVMVVLLTHSAAHAQTDSIPRGQIVERIEALNDSSQSYALYLPSNYTPDRKWPILYAFDP